MKKCLTVLIVSLMACNMLPIHIQADASVNNKPAEIQTISTVSGSAIKK